MQIRVWLPLAALVLALATVGCGQRDVASRDPAPDASVARPLDLTRVRQAQSAALGALLASQRPRARKAVRQLWAELLRLERVAREACRGDVWSLRPVDRERLHACAALRGLVAVNNELDRVLDPEAPAAELLDGLDRISALAGRVLSLPLVQSPLARLPRARVPVTELDLVAGRGGRARGGRSYRTCLARGLTQVVELSGAAVAHSLARLGGSPVLAWRRDCAAASPRCGADSVVSRRLDELGVAQGPVVDSQVDVTDWGLGEPFVIRGGPGGGVLLFGNDADQLVQLLGPKLRRKGPPRLVLAHARQVVPGRFATAPGPAWVSVADQGHRVTLRRFGPDHRTPVSRLALLAPDEVSGAFGAPALHGDAQGYAVAVTSLQHLHFARLDAQGSPLGPARRMVLGRGSLFDPQCTVIAREGKRYWTLTVGLRADQSAAGMLVRFDPQGRYKGPAVMLDLPIRVDREVRGGCPVWLLPTRRHLVVVALEAAVRGVAGRRLLAVEFKRDGKQAARPVVLATVKDLGGVVPTPDGFLASWTLPPPPEASPGAPQPISVGRWRCR